MEERVRERRVTGLVKSGPWGERLERLLASVSETSEVEERVGFSGMREEEEPIVGERGRREILRGG
jgi:hypothetical protein